MAVRMLRVWCLIGSLVLATIAMGDADRAQITDDRVREILRDGDARLGALRQNGVIEPAAVERVRWEARMSLPLEELTPRQLAAVHRSRLHRLDTPARRAAAVRHLARYPVDDTPTGAIVAILRLELLGGITWDGRPASDEQLRLLRQVLDHQHLEAVLRTGDGVQVFAAIRSLANEQVWASERDRILAIERVFGGDASVRLALGGEEFVQMIDSVAPDDPDLHVAVRKLVAAFGRHALVRCPAGCDLLTAAERELLSIRYPNGD